jgi:predicted dehydrogenase
MQSTSSHPKTRYAICGLSARAVYHFALPLLGKSTGVGAQDFSAQSEIVGILDLDPQRVSQFCEKFDLRIPCFSPEQGAEALIAETRPDVLLVAGPDHSHCDHILAGLRAGIRVISEKPVVIDCDQMRQVLDAEKISKGSLQVAHNYRYADTSRRIKRLLLEGRIGRITNVEFVYNLDTRHGASYFYRWNRERANSGGLSIHKCVHHVDLINWLVGSAPESVFAYGALNYYGSKGAHRPLPVGREVLTPAQTRERCPYFQQHYAAQGVSPEKLVTPGWDHLNLPYAAQYTKDRYIYDDEIDIEDTYSAVLRYQNGVSMSYSCNFSTPWEGYTLGINGTEGRLEVSHHSNPDPTGLTPAPAEQDTIVIMPLFGGREEIAVPLAEGGHGGADPMIQRDLFLAPSLESRELSLASSSYDGALAVAAGEAIWRSAKEQRPYTLAELLGPHYRD